MFHMCFCGGLRRSAALVVGYGVAGLLTAWGAAMPVSAHGQAARMMIVETDDGPGGGTNMMHFSMPDFSALRTPDYVRADLPDFNSILMLTDTQQVVVKTLLEDYLNKFNEALKNMLPKGMPGEMQVVELGEAGKGAFIALGDGPGAGGAGGAGGIDAQAGEIGELVAQALGDMDTMDVDVTGDGPGQMSVSIALSAGGASGPAGAGEGEDGGAAVWATSPADGAGGTDAPGVAIAVETPDGVEIPEELRQKLEEKATEMLEQLEAQQANGDFELDPDAMGAFGDFDPAEAMERHAEHHAKLLEAAETFRGEKQRLAAAFVNDVQAQLEEDQFTQWPKLERRLTRRKTLPKPHSRLDGESVDVLELLDRVVKSESSPVVDAATLEGYEVSLHDALLQRNTFMEDANQKIDDAIATGDFAAAYRTLDRAAQMRTTVRTINENYARAVAGELAEQDAALGAEFDEAFRTAAYGQVYRDTRADRAFKQALDLTDIDADTRSAIEALRDAYVQERIGVDASIVREIREHQPQEPRRSIEQLQASMESAEGGNAFFSSFREGDPVRAAFKVRTDLDERMMKQLYGMLGEEHVAQLPELPSVAKKRSRPIMIERIGGPN